MTETKEIKVEEKTEEEIYQMTDRPAQNVLLRELAQKEVNGVEEDKKDDETEEKEVKEDEKSQETDEKDVEDEGKDTDEEESDDSDEETQDDSKEEKEEKDEKEDEQEDPDEETLKAQEAEKKETRITDFMAKHSTPRDMAERVFESVDKIKTKYDGDPDKIAQSNYFLQREFSKLQQKIQEEERSRSNPFKWTDEKVTFHGVRENGEKYSEERSFDQIVNAQRQKEPDATKDLEDKAVFALAKLDNDKWFEYESKKRLDNVVNSASTKSDSFLKNLPESDKKFHDEVKEAINHLNPVDISTDDDSMKAVVNLIKGTHYDDMVAKYEEKIKKIEKDAFAKGKKNAKIIGEESEKADTQAKTKVKAGDGGYSDEHKTKAEQKFFNFRIPKEDKWKLYKEFLDDIK